MVWFYILCFVACLKCDVLCFQHKENKKKGKHFSLLLQIAFFCLIDYAYNTERVETADRERQPRQAAAHQWQRHQPRKGQGKSSSKVGKSFAFDRTGTGRFF